MNVVILQVFVTLILVAAGVVLFVYSAVHKDMDHCDRLSLLPLQEELRAERRTPSERES